MTLFWIACAVLLIVALLFVVLPLWRSVGGDNGGAEKEIQRDAANLEILRDQLAELEADLREGMLTQDAYEQGKRELQARLLEEASDSRMRWVRMRNWSNWFPAKRIYGRIMPTSMR